MLCFSGFSGERKKRVLFGEGNGMGVGREI